VTRAHPEAGSSVTAARVRELEQQLVDADRQIRDRQEALEEQSLREERLKAEVRVV
jgi:hypothetical protein